MPESEMILRAESALNKTQCDCFVTNHTGSRSNAPKEVTRILRKRVFLKDCWREMFYPRTRSVNVKEESATRGAMSQQIDRE